jgi:hypothetical protein
MRSRLLTVALAFAALAGPTSAEEPRPSGTIDRAPEEVVVVAPGGSTGGPAGGEAAQFSMEQPKAVPAPQTPRDVDEPGAPPDLTRPSANAGALRSLVRVRLIDGEARVRLDGAERTIRVGDSVAGDIVRRIEGGRIILARPEGDGREATVIVTFDAQGRARVRVFSTVDPRPLNPPDIR